MSLAAYLPRDRYAALRRGETLPQRTSGAALFADLSGFTPLTDALVQALGPRRGTEETTRHLNQVYDALIAQVDRYGGSVIGFSGDAITCWFATEDEGSIAGVAQRAAACALALQEAVSASAPSTLPGGGTLTVGLKVAVTSGEARRFLVGDPAIQVLEALAGAPITRLGTAEHLAAADEVLVDTATAAALGSVGEIAPWRTDEASGERYGVLRGLSVPVAPQPWEDGDAALPNATLRPWVLPAVYARHQAGLGDALTELRPTVALFLRFMGIDFVGDAEAGRHLDTFIRAVQGVLARYEGALLELTIGDKGSYLYATFGAPVAHEDDVQRAVRAAAALRALPDTLDFLQAVQIGLSRGVMRTGAYGGTTRRIYGVEGDEVNLAARLMQRAAPGEVLLSGRVQMALGDAFVLEPLAPLPLKGLPEPLPVFRLAGPRAVAVHLSEPAYALPMVGRTAELAVIEERLKLALGGQGQVVGITAEAGMGKSRLLAEVIRLARRRGLRAFGGACQSYGTSTPYLVWGPIWRGFFDLDPEAALRRQVRALEGEVEDLAPDRVEALPLLGPLLGLPLPENDLTRTLEPQYRKGALEALLVDCLRAAAREAREEGGGLLVVLEDLHWIDPTSHDLLELLARESATLPVLFVLAYRPPELLRLQPPRVEALPHFTRLTLAPLTVAETTQVIQSKLAQLLPDRRGLVTPALIERLMARAEGNPFYVEELLNYLHDRGIDPRDEAALQALELPTSLHSLLLSRIDQLTEGQQVTLKVASVMGRLVRFAWLHGGYPVLGPPRQLKAALDELSRLELTPLDTPEPELTYLFKHVVTQEVAYESLAHAARAVLHEQLAAYLESGAGDDATADVDLLAYHYERSGHGAKARLYLRRAGEAAAARYANAAAVDYLTRALALAPAAEAAERYALLRAREGIYDLQGDRAAQRQDLEALLQLAERHDGPGWMSAVAMRRAVLEEEVSDFPAATAAAQQAVALAQGGGLVAAEAAAQFQLGWVLWRQGTPAAAQVPPERSLTLARALGDVWLESRVLGSLGAVAYLQGDYSTAPTYFTQAVQAARASGNRQQESYSLHDLGGLTRTQGAYAQARAYLEQSLTIAQVTGDRLQEAYALGNLGKAVACQGDAVGARPYLEESAALARALSNRELEGANLYALGALALQAGHLEEAASAYLAAVTAFDRALLPVGVQEARAGLAHVALVKGDVPGARAHVDVILAQGEVGGSEGPAGDPFAVELICYQVLQVTGDPRAVALLEAAYARLQEQAARIADEAVRQSFLENVPPHRDLVAAWTARHAAEER